MTRRPAVRVAILDNARDLEVYAPVGHWKAHLRVPWTAFRPPEGRFPDPGDGFSHVILTGSEASILDRAPWVEEEARFVRAALGRGLSVLGSCWGHQLLAYALAGPGCVGRCRRPEIGWIPITIVKPGGLLGRRRTAYSFSLHYDEVHDLPADFEVLASTPVCAVQAFAVRGARAWGFQIHPEIDVPAARRTMRLMLDGGAGPAALYRSALASKPRDSLLIRSIVDGFLGLRRSAA